MANEKHGVIRTDRMYGTDVGANLVSVKYMGTGNAEAAIDNGCVVALNGLMTGEREIYKGVTPAADTALGKIALIATPEVMYDERKKNLEDYENEAGVTCRGYILHSGDIFSVTAEVLDATADIAVDNVVELQAGVKLKVVATATASTTAVGKVIAIEKAGRYTYYVIQVD